jgi:catechol 2,3-dioxygenase-like lactoylglutathione lyase family enzyme
MTGSDPGGVPSGRVAGLDHVALPMEQTDAMVAFYRSLGLAVEVRPWLVQVRLGDQMINFHRPELWASGEFPLRAPAAQPPCGDLCVVWEGSAEALLDLLDTASCEVVEGPVERQGGRGVDGSSVYVRDPDGNLLEFLRYPPD